MIKLIKNEAYAKTKLNPISPFLGPHHPKPNQDGKAGWAVHVSWHFRKDTQNMKMLPSISIKIIIP